MIVIWPGGFLYAAEDRSDHRRVCVRARDEASIREIAGWAKGIEVHRTPEADFPYRASVPAAVWASFCRTLAASIDYPSFALRRGYGEGAP